MSVPLLGWRYLSCRMRFVTVMIVVAILSETLSIATEYWSTHGPDEPVAHHRTGVLPREGLWTYIAYDNHDPDVGYRGVYQALAIVSLILVIGGCCVNWLCVHRQAGKVLIALFTFLSGLVLGACLALWSYNHLRFGWRMGWSFWVAVGSCGLQILCAAVTALEMFVDIRYKERRAAIDLPHVSPRKLRNEDEKADTETDKF